MGSVTQDLRYTFRMLARAPGFAAVAVLAVALGIGANSSIFTFINAYMLRPLPYPEPDRLVIASHISQPEKRIVRGVTPADLDAWRRHARTFEELAPFRQVLFNLAGGEQPEVLRGFATSAELFRILGAAPQLGRTFLPEEDQPGGARAVVLSHGLWTRQFAARRDALGSAVELNGQKYTVVGVMPPGFRFPGVETQLWATLQLGSFGREQSVWVVGRMRPGVSMAGAAADLGSLLEERGRVRLLTLHEELNHLRHAQTPLLVLLGAVGFVLLIACANVANLLLGRAVARAKEIAIRTTMGAGRARIIRQVLTESLVLAALGGVLGLGLGFAGVKLLMAAAPAYMLPIADLKPDATVLLFTAAVSLIAGLLFGMAPAFQISRARLHETLKEGGRSSAVSGRGWLRRTLVVAEIAPAVVLLIGAALLLKSFAKMQSVDLGFQAGGVLTADLILPPAKYPEAAQRATYFERAIENLERIPGAAAAGVVNRLGQGGRRPIAVEGRPAPAPGEETYVGYRTASPGYFRALRIPLRAGRYFDEREPVPAAIVNETMAKRFWPGESPVGRMLRFTVGEMQSWMTVVGVVGDDRRELTGEVWPEMYAPYRQDPPIAASIVLYMKTDAASATTALRAAVTEPLASVRTMEERLADEIAPQRVTMQMLAAFAAVALFLATMGLYGVISYSVTQRTQEMGIRMALGAARGDLLRMVVGQGAVLAGIGIALGLAMAFGVTRLMAALLFGVSATDTAIFAAVPAALAAVALLASYVPARRAAGLDPVVALRQE